MATREFHDQYLVYLEGLAIDLTKDGTCCEPTLGKAESLVQSVTVSRSLNQISPEEAEAIYNAIFKLYPQFEEKSGQN
jgi:hypothetical protein